MGEGKKKKNTSRLLCFYMYLCGCIYENCNNFQNLSNCIHVLHCDLIKNSPEVQKKITVFLS